MPKYVTHLVPKRDRKRPYHLFACSSSSKQYGINSLHGHYVSHIPQGQTDDENSRFHYIETMDVETCEHMTQAGSQPRPPPPSACFAGRASKPD
jgi:hypothetical protein